MLNTKLYLSLINGHIFKIFLILFMLSNTSTGNASRIFNLTVPNWSFNANPTDPLFNYSSNIYFQGVLSRTDSTFAPSILVFKISLQELRSKNMSFKVWLETELFENRSNLIRTESTPGMKTFVYSHSVDSISFVYVFQIPDAIVIMTQDTYTDTQYQDFNRTKHDLSQAVIN